MPETGGWRRQLKSFFSWGWRFGPGPVPAVTVELPLTPAHVFALRHHVRSERQWLIGATAAGATFALLLSAVPSGGRPIPFVIVVYIAAFVVSIGLIFDWLGWRRGHEAELRKGVYYRVSGPIRIYTGRDTGRVEVGDAKIHYVSSVICGKLRDLPFGYVDYAPRSRVILEQRDADGELLYRLPAYRPDDDPTITRRLPSLLTPIIWGAGASVVLMVGLAALVAWAESHR